jgi:hypothetical protein
MREGKFDVRKLDFNQLSNVIKLIAFYQKQDLHVFFKYIISCLEAEFYPKKVLHDNFSNFSKLFYIFAREGFIAPDQHTRLYFSYVMTLRDKMEKEGAAAVNYHDLIHVLWSLIATEDESINNPIIPKLYERLHDFKRSDNPIS